MPETTQAESGKKINIGCEVDLEPMSEACLDFAKTWENTIESKLRQNNFCIIKANQEVSPENGKCSASITVVYVGPHKYIDFPLESDESSASPTSLSIVNVLQKSYNNSSLGKDKEAIYAALSVNGNSLEKPSNKNTQEQQEEATSHVKKEKDLDNNSSEDAFEEGDSEELFPHIEDKPKFLTSFNLNHGTIKFSDGTSIQLSHEFKDNFSIDVTDLVPTYKLTMNESYVKALDVDAEGKLARRFKNCIENVETAIEQHIPSSSSNDGTDESTSGDEY